MSAMLHVVYSYFCVIVIVILRHGHALCFLETLWCHCDIIEGCIEKVKRVLYSSIHALPCDILIYMVS